MKIFCVAFRLATLVCQLFIGAGAEETAPSSGQVWLEISTGVPLRETSRCSVVQVSSQGRLRTKIDVTDEAVVVSRQSIDPAAPLPPPLREKDGADITTPPAMPDEGQIPVSPGPDAVLLRVVLKPGTRTLLTHAVRIGIGMEMPGMKQDKIRFKMVDEVEEIVRADEGPGELRHECRRLARVGELPGKNGISFDSRKWEAGDQSMDPSLVEDWKRVRATTVFLIRGADGRPVRSWAEGPDMKTPPPPTPLAARAMETYLEAKVFSPGFLPPEPVSPGAVWSLRTTLDSAGMADEVAVTGTYTLKSVDRVDGRRLAVVEFSGVMAPAEPAAPPKPGSGTVEKGQVEGTFSIDLDRASWVHRRVRSQYSALLQTPGLKSKIRQEIDQEVEQTFHSETPLPPDP